MKRVKPETETKAERERETEVDRPRKRDRERKKEKDKKVPKIQRQRKRNRYNLASLKEHLFLSPKGGSGIPLQGRELKRTNESERENKNRIRYQ